MADTDNNTSTSITIEAPVELKSHVVEFGRVLEDSGMFTFACEREGCSESWMAVDMKQTDGSILTAIESLRGSYEVHLMDVHKMVVDHTPEGLLIVVGPMPTEQPAAEPTKPAFKGKPCFCGYVATSGKDMSSHKKACSVWQEHLHPAPAPVPEPEPLPAPAPALPDPVQETLPQPETRLTVKQAWAFVDKLDSLIMNVAQKETEAVSFYEDIASKEARVSEIESRMPQFEHFVAVHLITSSFLAELLDVLDVLKADLAMSAVTKKYAVGKVAAQSVAEKRAAEKLTRDINDTEAAGQTALQQAIKDWQRSQDELFDKLVSGALWVPSNDGEIPFLRDMNWSVAHGMKGSTKDNQAEVMLEEVAKRMPYYGFNTHKHITVKAPGYITNKKGQPEKRTVTYEGDGEWDMATHVKLVANYMLNLRGCFGQLKKAADGKAPTWDEQFALFSKQNKYKAQPKEATLTRADLGIPPSRKGKGQSISDADYARLEKVLSGKGDSDADQPGRSH